METSTTLIQRLNEMTTALAAHPVLAIIGSDALSPDEWRQFAVQRYLSAMIFESLLDTAITKAAKASDTALVAALTKNQDDELGMDAEGNFDKTAAHAAWRRDFYDALGIDDDLLNAHVVSPAVKAYIEIIRSVIASGEYLVMSGALLALERFFPLEFRAMQQGRDTVFADVFLDQPADDEAKKSWRARARLYLDDHILHDANAHYPDLLKALQPHTANDADMARLLAGIDAVQRAKEAFYDDLNIKN